jgi:methylmalonyl-CoA mutase C-terminal domain/subunit
MPIKCLITKSQIDAHDKGARFIATALKEAGMEVVYTRFATPDEIVETALQEDVDVIGISLLCGGYTYTISRVMELLKEKKMDALLMVGGQIPDDEGERILEMGIDRIFSQGATAAEVIDYITSKVPKKEPAPGA